MSESRTRRGAALLVELGVVFLGVLIALAVEAWWAERGEQARVRSYMSAVESDMVTAQVQLDSALALARQNLEGVGGFLEKARSDVETSDVAPGFRGSQLFIPMGMLDALIATGEINLLEDEALRARMVHSHSLLAYRQRRLEELSSQHLDNIQAAGLVTAILLDAQGLPAGPVPINAVRRSPELMSAYEAYGFLVRNQIGEMQGMRLSVERLLEAITESRGGGP